MSYIDKSLIENEQIIFRTKKSLIIFLSPIFWTAFCCFFLYIDNYLIQKVSFILIFVAAAYWLKELVVYYFSDFVITNIRVMMREGFFIRHTNDTRLAALANVTVDQSLIGQLCNYGTIYLNSFGGEKDPFRNVSHPVEFQKKLQAQLYHLQTPFTQK